MPKWFNVWNDIQRARNKTKMLNQPVGRAGCAINLAKATGQNTQVLVFKSRVTWAARMKAENSAEKPKPKPEKVKNNDMKSAESANSSRVKVKYVHGVKRSFYEIF